MFEPSRSLVEIVFRVCVLYGALVVRVRLAGKREVGQLDLLAIAAATLLAATALRGRLTFRSRRAERWIEGAPVVGVEDGRIVEPNGEISVLSRDGTRGAR